MVTLCFHELELGAIPVSIVCISFALVDAAVFVLLIIAASKNKAIRRGVKEVVKALRKNEKGYVHFLFA
jgi:hypothetical protein